jgi:hypothetical protein
MKHIKGVFAVFCLVFILDVNAQYELVFGDQNINEKAIASHRMSDGSFWIVGFTNSGTNGDADVSITRLDSNGNVLFPLTYFGSLDNDYPNNMLYKEGRLIIAGETHKSNNNIDGFILVVDSTGIFESFDTYGLPGQTEQFFDIKPTQDTGFVVSGFASLPNSVGNDFLMAKFDKRSVFEWSKIHDLGTNDIGMVVVEKPQGGYILVGDQLQSGGNYNVALIGCDEMGNMLWDTTVANPYNGGCRQVTIHDGQLIIVGEMSTATSAAFDLYLIRTDLQGNLIWQGTIPKTDKGDAAFDLIVKSLNEIYITGYAYVDSIKGTDLVVMEIDSVGNIINEIYYGGTSLDMGLDLKVQDDGHFMVSGFKSGDFSNEYYVIYNSFDLINSVWSPQMQEDNFKPFYPNPTSDKVNFPEEFENHEVVISDELGRTFIMKMSHQQIDLSDFNSGKYWLFVKDNKGNTVHAQTVVKL